MLVFKRFEKNESKSQPLSKSVPAGFFFLCLALILIKVFGSSFFIPFRSEAIANLKIFRFPGKSLKTLVQNEWIFHSLTKFLENFYQISQFTSKLIFLTDFNFQVKHSSSVLGFGNRFTCGGFGLVGEELKDMRCATNV
jgi:hypothetical protein